VSLRSLIRTGGARLAAGALALTGVAPAHSAAPAHHDSYTLTLSSHDDNYWQAHDGEWVVLAARAVQRRGDNPMLGPG
jgi:hypothetical protein